MAGLIVSAIGVLIGTGTYLVLRGRSFPVVAGLVLLSYGVNLFLVSMGRLSMPAPPIIVPGEAGYGDPLPQALVLTAIVIGFGMTAFVVALAVRTYLTFGDDHVDPKRLDR